VQFNGETQERNENNEEYIRALYSSAQYCEFGNVVNDNIKYRLLTGIKDKALSIELQHMTVEQLTLENVTQRMRAKEIIQRNLVSAAPEQQAGVVAIKKKKCSAKKAYNE